jgi:hypothetical protein
MGERDGAMTDGPCKRSSMLGAVTFQLLHKILNQPFKVWSASGHHPWDRDPDSAHSEAFYLSITNPHGALGECVLQ